ncbi:hypothetical protein RHGRI_021266 [Rhododendron griersonianum]|uniref:Uncharacterized protein n=1 Tax=Rhododendron griersonianum TaxID=479676 RepID=A0AAV6JJJ1_9ERIC|nr:hypothetical protein RHGRI_021266 [Rhododendron griersonianum]
MASAKKWAGIISYIAGRLYFYLIIFQIPLFSVPCKRGVCTTPIQVTAGHLIGTVKWPAVFVKATMYPGAIFESLLFKTEVPTFNGLLHAYNMTALDETFDVQRIEILVGSIFSVFGALTSIRPGRTSMLGSSLITWGILRETLYAVYARRRIEVFTFPTLLIATLLAFLSIKSDVRYLIRSFRPRRQKKEKKA